MNVQDLEFALGEARAWLDLADRDQYDSTWARAGSRFRTGITQAQWAERLREMRESVGVVQSRQLESLTYTRRLPDLPIGEYVVIVHDCKCSKEQGPISETISLERESDGTYRVLGFFLGALAKNQKAPPDA